MYLGAAAELTQHCSAQRTDPPSRTPFPSLSTRCSTAQDAEIPAFPASLDSISSPLVNWKLVHSRMRLACGSLGLSWVWCGSWWPCAPQRLGCRRLRGHRAPRPREPTMGTICPQVQLESPWGWGRRDGPFASGMNYPWSFILRLEFLQNPAAAVAVPQRQASGQTVLSMKERDWFHPVTNILPPHPPPRALF